MDSKKLYQRKTPPFWESIQSYFKTNIGILAAFLLFFTMLSIWSEHFLTSRNMINVMRQITTNANLAVGIMLCILIGGIDLSVGSVVALSGVVTVKLIVEAGMSIPVAFAMGLLSGVVSGAASGLIIAYTEMPPFIVTLAMQNICRGAAYLIAGGNPIRITQGAFESIGTGYIGWAPLPVIYTAVILICAFFIINKSRLGRHIYAIGGNKEAARYSGINVKRVEIFVYTLSGLLAAFSGIIYAARMASGQPAVAIGFETDAISAVVVGGVSMTGGVGTLGGVILGSLLIGIISNGLNLIRVSSFWQYVVKGVIILIAVYMDMYRKRKERF